MTILAFSKPAIHFPIALLLLFGFKQPAQAAPAVRVTQTLTASESLTELGIQTAASPTSNPAKALFERAIQIADANGFAGLGQFEKARQAAEEISEDLARVAVISELAK